MIPELTRFKTAERWLVRRLRMWLDRVDESLHRWEVATRGEAPPVVVVIAGAEAQIAQEIGSEWERPPIVSTRKSARAPKKRRRMTAAEFDADMRRRIDARMEYAR